MPTKIQGPGTASFLELSYIFCLLFSHYKYQFCGSELIFQIRIRINNLDPDPTLSLYRKLSPEAKKVINIYKFVYVGSVTLKGQSNEIFDLQLFSSFEPAWATEQWLKIFSILIKISLSYLNFYEAPWGIIPRRVIC